MHETGAYYNVYTKLRINGITIKGGIYKLREIFFI